jgi:lipopolysaccharide transport system permease protein
MAKREVIGRYKGSAMGLLWSFLNPVFMLVIYTFVFSVVFKARWSGFEGETKTQFAVVLFVGMIVHALFAEVLNRAPGIIIANTNYVKKIVFPLEILPVISLMAALFHSLISFLVLLIAFVLFNGYLHWTIIFAPVIILPFVIMTMGFAWIFASLGVYLRDIGQTIGILMTVLGFLAPVFYPISALPEKFQPYMKLNPLTLIIEEERAALIFGRQPDWSGLTMYSLIAIAICWMGYVWFQKTRRGFADVL